MLKNSDEATKLFLIGIVFLIMILYILFTSIGDNKKVDYSFINNSINDLKDNYTLDVKIGDKEITYATDGKVEVFESNSFENKKYIKYKNVIYVVNNDELKEVENNNDLVDKYNYDLNLIKNLMNYCNFKRNSSQSVKCSIPDEIYNKELSKLYGLGKADKNDVIIYFFYEGKVVNKITYSTDKDVIVLTIKDSLKNDFSKYIE